MSIFFISTEAPLQIVWKSITNAIIRHFIPIFQGIGISYSEIEKAIQICTLFYWCDCAHKYFESIDLSMKQL